jgi:signal peptidase II
MGVPPKFLAFVLPALLVVPLDQWAKHWIVRNIEFGGEIPVIDGFFSLTHVLNRGIVFGWFQGGDVAVFVVLTLLAVGLIFSFYRQLPVEDRLSATALGLILGGAIGNLVDRLLRKAVVDFLHFDFGFFVYPDFNIADSAIVVGVGVLLLRRGAWVSTPEPSADDARQRGAQTAAD